MSDNFMMLLPESVMQRSPTQSGSRPTAVVTEVGAAGPPRLPGAQPVRLHLSHRATRVGALAPRTFEERLTS